MPSYRTLFALTLPLSLAASPTVFADGDPDTDGDGAPHIAVAQESSGELELEYEIFAGFDDSTDPPTITLDTSVYDSSFPGFRTFPVNDTPSPNDDLGFVSEVEGASEEGTAINGDIVVRLLSKDDMFSAFFAGDEIWASPGDEVDLGDTFDYHPIWVLSTTDQSFRGSTSASFEVFDTLGGTNESLGRFDVVLAVPEPTSAALLAGLGGLALIRRRRRSVA